jgi:hypothetical protein
LVLRKVGVLGTNDQKRVTAAVKTLFFA